MSNEHAETNEHSTPMLLSLGGRPNRGTLYRKSTLLWLAGIALLSVPMVTLVDVPIARYFSTNPWPREAGDALNLMLMFSHGWGIFLILFAIILLAPSHRWHVPRLAALAMGGGAVATLGKMFILRPRPNSMNLEIASYDTAWLWAFDWTLEQVAAYDASTRAFPSSNIATATALTLGLWIMLPRGRYLFGTVWVGAFLQRIYCGSHFMSDLFGGIAFGFLWSYVCLDPKLLGSVFDKMQPEQDRHLRSPREEGELPEEQTDEAALPDRIAA